jgi:hypothetical protein
VQRDQCLVSEAENYRRGTCDLIRSVLFAWLCISFLPFGEAPFAGRRWLHFKPGPDFSVGPVFLFGGVAVAWHFAAGFGEMTPDGWRSTGGALRGMSRFGFATGAAGRAALLEAH